MPQIVNIAIDRLFPHSDNPRKDLGDLSELAASIKASGILQNLTVVPDEPDNSNTDFTIIIGHRRYAAAKIAGLTELPCVVVNVSRGGPGLGTIQPSQADYFQAVKGGGHGDYHLIVLAPYSVQEMYDFVPLGFDLAFKYRNPVMILSDGVIGQMMEKVVLSPARPRWTDDRIAERCGAWAATGKPSSRGRNIVTSVELDSLVQERFNLKLKAKYDAIRRDEVRFEQTLCDDADYVLVAYGSSARIALKVVEMARADGHRVGLLRPITLFPFPTEAIDGLSRRVKGFLSVEMSTGQMVEDVMLASRFRVPVRHYGRTGGVVHSPGEVYDALKSNFSLQ